MYHTATISVYDVLHTVFVSCRVLEYSSTPGTLSPSEFVYSTSITSIGENNPQLWLQRALSHMAAELQY